MNTEVPIIVKEAAKQLIERYGDSFRYLGSYKGEEVYQFRFPIHVQTGFPFVFLLNPEKNNVTGKTGYEASNIINELYKNNK